jgi:hypothetical protein
LLNASCRSKYRNELPHFAIVGYDRHGRAERMSGDSIRAFEL